MFPGLQRIHVQYSTCIKAAQASAREGVKNGTDHPRDVKARLAREICAQFYDEETAKKAEAEFNKMFVGKDLPDEIPEFVIPDAERKDSKIWIIKLLVISGLAKTNGEARRLIQGGGVYIDNERVDDENHEISIPVDCIVKVGKRRFLNVKGN